MKVYGLTGGIASGKTAAGRRFAELGIPVIEADRLGHEALAPGGVAEEAVMEAFGAMIVTDGQIDREKLGAKVFSDTSALETLNALVHPAVREEIARQCGALLDAAHRAAIIEAALHAENGEVGEELRGLILVHCPEEERLRRLVELRGMDEEEARRRIAAQTPPEQKIHLAEWLIRNDADLEELHRQVDRVAEEL